VKNLEPKCVEKQNAVSKESLQDRSRCQQRTILFVCALYNTTRRNRRNCSSSSHKTVDVFIKVVTDCQLFSPLLLSITSPLLNRPILHVEWYASSIQLNHLVARLMMLIEPPQEISAFRVASSAKIKANLVLAIFTLVTTAFDGIQLYTNPRKFEI
jgi:hypothetical protein